MKFIAALMCTVASPDPNPNGRGELSNPNECTSTLTNATKGETLSETVHILVKMIGFRAVRKDVDCTRAETANSCTVIFSGALDKQFICKKKLLGKRQKQIFPLKKILGGLSFRGLSF